MVLSEAAPSKLVCCAPKARNRRQLSNDFNGQEAVRPVLVRRARMQTFRWVRRLELTRRQHPYVELRPAPLRLHIATGDMTASRLQRGLFRCFRCVLSPAALSSSGPVSFRVPRSLELRRWNREWNRTRSSNGRRIVRRLSFIHLWNRSIGG